jgi:DNA-binding NarL/FixJ family response regulator
MQPTFAPGWAEPQRSQLTCRREAGIVRAVVGISGPGVPLRVVFADDSYLPREAIAHLLASDPRVELVAVCSDGDALRESVARGDVDVVVTDIRMPPSGDDEGIRVANLLRKTHPHVGVVVVSQYADPRYGLALLEHGSDGRAYLLKERLHDRENLLSAIETVASGGSVIDSKVVEALIAAHVHDEESALADLTQRELEILSAIAQGLSNQAIAESLVLTKRAVEKHINAIFAKLGLTENEDVSRRVKAALIYLGELSPSG